MRRWLTGAVLIYFLYGLFMYWYIFMGADSGLPKGLQGTAADPAQFMNGREQMLTDEYSKMKDFIFLVTVPFEWFLYFVVLITGLSRKMQKWAEGTVKFSVLQTLIFLFWLSLLVSVLSLPVNYLSHMVSETYHISTQSLSGWLKDQLIDFWVNFLTMAVLAIVLLWLIRKFEKRWWLYAWLLSIPFTLFLMFIQPVVIDPLYNKFYPLQNKQLETKILAMAHQANIPADHVYEVNMSAKTSTMNAYVTGIGSNSRIVLWDTTLKKLKENEILFIMAHEMGHYVMKHIYIGIAVYLALSFVGLFLVQKLMGWLIRRRGKLLKLSSVREISALPLFLLLISFLTFAVSPVTNWISRAQEKSADLYAMEMTGDHKAAVKTFQELSRNSLSQVNPPELVKILRYNHPTMSERILYLEEEGK
ncbi:M48 family metallopeptidase [Metabacillus sp. GX 13764]|uniref:M48 family metallopeptidase n=1 Tax=Metabacillus kandeliae TaxID=2900151 RepID=UPI001E4939C9|nr:M48 family metallopeptidase [Metabacillus kandeliae]MCD7034881.1 M48 family metallopeptidase [Metabacillus kandeliae]